METTYKVVITGSFNAGKTTFINTLSDIEIVNTDKATSTASEQSVKLATTTALDYGRVKLDDEVQVHLFGTPGQPRFDFMWDILTKDMDGFVFLVDGADRSRLDEAGRLLVRFQEADIPYVVAVNKADLKGLSLEEAKIQLDLPDQALLIPCVATQKTSARLVIKRLIDLIERRI